MIDERTAVDLDRMQQAAADALEFTAGMSEADFLADAKTRAAVMMCMIIIGEAANRIMTRSADFISTHPDWPWDKMRARRNRTVHGYDTIDFRIIWVVLRDSIPDLLKAVNALGSLDPRLRDDS